MALILFFILVLVASIFVPQYVVALIVLNLFTGLFLSIIQIVITLLPRFRPKRREIVEHPFVSVLVPAYNEPPAVLIQTIETLSRLQYDRFEVLVIDNNTRDESVWRPVERFMQTLGERFRFFHLDHLEGFKAGALNYLLDRLDARSEYVAVIDADYLVREDFLMTAVSHFVDQKIALVQFPQNYWNLMSENEPIADEYSHFFEIYMNMANHFDCVPSTGTVSVYRLSVLGEVGGFRGEALTEDADIGLRIYAAGFRGVYVDQPIGNGLLPYDLEAYRGQKWRWAFGNAQSLKTLILLFGKVPFVSWVGFLSHLTAWHHFQFLPFAALAAFPFILLPIIPISSHHREILLFAALSIFFTIAGKLILFMITIRRQGGTFARALRAFVVHMGMTLVYSEAILAFLFRMKLGFVRTNKFILARIPSLLKNTCGELILGLWYLVGATIAFLYGEIAMAIAFLMAASALFSIYYIHLKISPTREYTQKIMEEAERRCRPYLQVK